MKKLIAITALAFACGHAPARGAKLCMKNLSWASDSYSSDGFALGWDCGNSWQLPNYATACGVALAQGNSTTRGPCASGAFYDSPVAGSGYLYCRHTAPDNRAKWLCLGPDGGNAPANGCGLHIAASMPMVVKFLYEGN